MPEPANKAVFLSYASQDAEAARRICDALTAAGVEVWFDQSELRGGDAWDAKIRRQIKECALFVPVISANTEAREEGYFRLEWLLAVERSRLRADDAHFLFPVVVDGTSEAVARVPDRFREVQWTRLDFRETPANFAAQVAKLLSGKSAREATSPDASRPSESAAHRPKAATRSKTLRWFVGLLVIASGVVVAGRLWPRRTAGPGEIGAAAGPSTAQAGSIHPAGPDRDWPHDPELKRAIRLIDAFDSTHEDFALAEDIAQRAVDQSPFDAEHVTVLARVESQYLLRAFDPSPERISLAKKYAERAVQLAPDEPEALYAQAIVLGYRVMGDLAQAVSLLQRACGLDPGQPRYWRELAANVTRQHPAEGLALAEQNVVRFPKDPLIRYELSILYRDNGQYQNFERELDATVQLGPIANAFDWKARVAFVHGNLAEMKTWIDRVPAKNRGEERTVLTRFVYAATSGQVEEGLVAIRNFTDPWFLDTNNYSGPTALLRAELWSLEGKPELAHLQYEAALAELRRHEADNPGNIEASYDGIWIFRGLGQKEEALAHNRIVLEALHHPYRPFPIGLWWFSSIPASLLLGEHDTAIQLTREAALSPESGNWVRVCLRLDPRMAPWRNDAQITAILSSPAEGSK
jgi:tetratricopeptide (TPR) repeat protein